MQLITLVLTTSQLNLKSKVVSGPTGHKTFRHEYLHAIDHASTHN